jgi:hypothetical protein
MDVMVVFLSKEELYYIKTEYIIKLRTTLSKYSRSKQLLSVPNLCKKQIKCRT